MPSAPGSDKTPIFDQQDNRIRGIMVVSHDALPFGAQLAALAVVRELVENYAVKVWVLLKQGGPLKEAFAALAPTVVLRDGDQPLMDDAFDRVVTSQKQEGLAVALCNTAVCGDLALRLKGHGLTVISAIHELSTGIQQYASPDLLHQAVRGSDHVIFVSEMVRDELVRAFDLPPGRFYVRSPGILRPSPFAENRAAARAQVAKELSLSEEASIVLGCGFAIQRKGVDLFVLLAKTVLDHADQDIHFAWVGREDQAYTAWCRHDLARLGISDRVHLLGERPEPGLYYAAADVFVLPSREDPFPLVCIEAMEAGVPVVAFQGGGGTVELVGADAGVLVPYLDVPAMAAAVSDLLGNPAARQSVGSAARKRVEDLNIAGYVRFITQLLSGSMELQRPREATAAEGPKLNGVLSGGERPAQRPPGDAAGSDIGPEDEVLDRAQAFERAGEIQAQYDTLDAACRRFPAHDGIRLALANLLEDQGFPGEAIVILGDGLDQPSPPAALYLRLARILEQQGQTADAANAREMAARISRSAEQVRQPVPGPAFSDSFVAVLEGQGDGYSMSVEGLSEIPPPNGSGNGREH